MQFQLYGERGHLIQNPSDLPEPTEFDTLYVDVETTGLFPYRREHFICGFGFTFDTSKDVWYIPMRHRDDVWNLRGFDFTKYIRDLVRNARVIVGHNVKFDAKFIEKEIGESIDAELHDTSVLSKIIDTDRLSHHLKELGRDVLHHPMEEKDEVRDYVRSLKRRWANKKEGPEPNYSDVPGDTLGKYCCVDVSVCRLLYLKLLSVLPERSKGIWRTEIDLAPLLMEMETEGLRTSKTKLLVEQVKSEAACLAAYDEMYRITAGIWFHDSPAWFKKVLLDKHGLPTLVYTTKVDPVTKRRITTTNPSFDKNAIPVYLEHAGVPDEVKQILRQVEKIRAVEQFKNLYVIPFLELLSDSERLHPVYQQIKRTGRMSCTEPNVQQMDKKAKSLILPDEGCAFLLWDASQIEFRLTAHFIGVDTYASDPDTDYHQWVADLCGIDRKHAKNVNFAMCYGAGKSKIIKMLTGAVGEERALGIYEEYHRQLPGIRKHLLLAEQTCKSRGYVVNPLGRRRHLPSWRAYSAFNSVIQGFAMDIIKTMMVRLHKDDFLRSRGVRMCHNIHDEIGFQGPPDVIRQPDVLLYIQSVLEEPPVPLNVPIRWNAEISEGALSEAVKIDLPRCERAGSS